jgi:tetratricopeptide (TPR) repeat protein
VVVASGLGGAGKTQLVLSYLQRYQSTYKAVFWIDAEQQSSIDRDFVHVYQMLFNIRLSGSHGSADAQSAITAVKSWMSSAADVTLLVLDGADEVEDTSSAQYVDLRRLIPGGLQTHVIITSRSRTALGLSSFEGVRIAELDPPQATELFRKSAKLAQDRPGTDSQVEAIVEELGYLALAVSLAGTYISQTPQLSADLDEYLTEYRQRRHQLLAQTPSALVHQYGESVMTTWEASFAAIHHRSSEAARLLMLLAYLDNNDVFLDLFRLDGSSVQTPDRRWLSAVWGNRDVNVYKLEGCFGVLESFCLVQRSPSQSGYAMHKLVHAWARDRLVDDEVEQERYCDAAFWLLEEAASGGPEDPKYRLRVAPHVMANFVATKDMALRRDGDITIPLEELAGMARFVYGCGQWANAVSIRRFVLEEKVRILGDDHPDTLSVMNDLAVPLRDQGKLPEAAAIQTEVLEKRKRVLGDDHPDTLSAMNNLANTLSDQGKLPEAAAIQTEVLEKMKQILGDDHPDTLRAINNLAVMLSYQGKRPEAAGILTEVLEKRKRILGDDHPDTLSAMSNLANTLSDQGKIPEAAAIRTEVLEKMKQVLGDDHPDTLSAMSNLAVTLSDQGKLSEAAAMKTEVLKKRKRILGDDHPNTLSAMNNLATTLSDQGKLPEAAAIQTEVLEKRKRVLGDDHPDTLSAMNNLANTFSDQGKLPEAAAIHTEVLEKRKRILGGDHPDTLRAMSNLAATLGDRGELSEAAQIFQEVLDRRRQILGEDHPATLLAIKNLQIISEMIARK